MVGIYKITSPSGQVYIGQSRDIASRKSTYRRLKANSQHKLQRSFVKYGFENHSFETISQLPKDVSDKVLDNYEILYWELYVSCGCRMLNLKYPGKYGRHSKESIDRIKFTLTGHTVSDETRKKLSVKITAILNDPEQQAKRKKTTVGNKGKTGGKKYPRAYMPSIERLTDLGKKYTLKNIGLMYGVTGEAVHLWMKNYKIQYVKKNKNFNKKAVPQRNGYA
jgi:group I intron endonuclease